MTARMRAEQTDNPLVMQWLVQDDLVDGAATIGGGSEGVEDLPEELADLLAFGRVERLVVAPGRLRFHVADPGDWSDLEPAIQAALVRFFDGGGELRVSNGPVDDGELAEGVVRLLQGPLADYVASHGGEIALQSVRQGIVTVELHGSCQGCPSSETTLKVGIEEQLRSEFPEIVEVRSVEEPPELGARKYLPLIT
jgi:Fe-S cluster biogenesis protein NfuA